MKMKFCQWMTLFFSSALVMTADAQTTNTNNNVILPLIHIDKAPLPDAIRVLAWQAQMNVILDPRVLAGRTATNVISFRWENVTMRQALSAVLDNHALKSVEIPGTGV